MTQPTVFISYSHEDEKEKNALLKHLEVLQKAGLIDLWSDDRIGAGADWEKEIEQAMARARMAILLVSANFLTSEFVLDKQVPALLERRQREGLIIFPVIARDCAWRAVDWLSRMEVWPKDDRAILGGGQVDEDLRALAEEVALAVDPERFGERLRRRVSTFDGPLQRPAWAEHFTDREKELAQLLAELQPGRVASSTTARDDENCKIAMEWAKKGGNEFLGYRDFSRCNLRGVVLKGADLREAILNNANLCDAILKEVNLEGAKLRQASLDQANLSSANLQGADLRGANLPNANLSKANLSYADLRDGASLRGADLTGANLTEAKLKGVKYDYRTTWPENFDPDKAGAIRED